MNALQNFVPLLHLLRMPSFFSRIFLSFAGPLGRLSSLLPKYIIFNSNQLISTHFIYGYFFIFSCLFIFEIFLSHISYYYLFTHTYKLLTYLYHFYIYLKVQSVTSIILSITNIL